MKVDIVLLTCQIALADYGWLCLEPFTNNVLYLVRQHLEYLTKILMEIGHNLTLRGTYIGFPKTKAPKFLVMMKKVRCVRLGNFIRTRRSVNPGVTFR